MDKILWHREGKRKYPRLGFQTTLHFKKFGRGEKAERDRKYTSCELGKETKRNKKASYEVSHP